MRKVLGDGRSLRDEMLVHAGSFRFRCIREHDFFMVEALIFQCFFFFSRMEE